MFRLARFALTLGIAFLGGMFFERLQQMDECERAGGDWARPGGYCAKAEE